MCRSQVGSASGTTRTDGLTYARRTGERPRDKKVFRCWSIRIRGRRLDRMYEFASDGDKEVVVDAEEANRVDAMQPR